MEYVQREHVVLPSDYADQEIRKSGLNYTRIRSGKAKIFNQKEIEDFVKARPEPALPYQIWKRELRWRMLIESKGCRIR